MKNINATSALQYFSVLIIYHLWSYPVFIAKNKSHLWSYPVYIANNKSHMWSYPVFIAKNKLKFCQIQKLYNQQMEIFHQSFLGYFHLSL